jgi:hypothetical protein
MSQFARVASIDVLPLIASGLQKFRGHCGAALDDLEIEIRRVQEWIDHDRKEYWSRELNRAYENLNQARVQLHQAKVARKVGQHEPACVDEKRVVERAQHRVRIAHEKIEAVRHWKRAIDRAIDDFMRGRAQFATWLETELPHAATALNQMSESLVTYISMEAPPDPAAPAAGLKTPNLEHDGASATSAGGAPTGRKEDQP